MERCDDWGWRLRLPLGWRPQPIAQEGGSARLRRRARPGTCRPGYPGGPGPSRCQRRHDHDAVPPSQPPRMRPCAFARYAAAARSWYPRSSSRPVWSRCRSIASVRGGGTARAAWAARAWAGHGVAPCRSERGVTVWRRGGGPGSEPAELGRMRGGGTRGGRRGIQERREEEKGGGVPARWCTTGPLALRRPA